MDFEQNARLFKALGHPLRLKMAYHLMGDHDCNVNKMAEMLRVPQSSVSQQLGVLKSCDIIAPKKYGVNTCYQIVDPLTRDLLKLLGFKNQKQG